MSIFVALFIAIWVSRGLYALLQRAGFVTTTPTTRNTWDVDARPWHVIWAIGGTVWVALGVLLVGGARTPGTVVAWLVGVVVLFPWPIARATTIALGLPRLSARLAKLATYTWGSDPAGAAALVAVLAAARTQPSSSSSSSSWPQRAWRRAAHRPAADLQYARERVQGLKLVSSAGVVATALLADLDDAPKQADAIFATLALFDPRVVAPAATRIERERRLQRILAGAHDDLDLDVAARIAARRDAALAITDHRSPTVHLLQILLRLDVAPDDASLRRRARIWWLAAPRRRQTLVWLRCRPRGWPLPTKATTTEKTTTTTATTPAVDNDEAALARALRLHVEAARQPPSVALATEVAVAWERGIEASGTSARLRARTLGVDGDDVVAGLTATVQQALVAMADKLDLSAVDTALLPARFALAVADVRSVRLDALETTAAAWRARIDGTVDLASVDELREWVALQELVEAVARTGSDGRYVAYEAMQWVVCERAVRLWNVRNQPRLGNAMFRWLLREAGRVDDPRGIETQGANVKCGP